MGIWPCSMASSGYLIVSKIMAIIQAEITAGQNPHLSFIGTKMSLRGHQKAGESRQHLAGKFVFPPASKTERTTPRWMK